MAAYPLMSNCSSLELWNSGKVMEVGVLPTRNGEQKGLRVCEPHRGLLDFKIKYSENQKLVFDLAIWKKITAPGMVSVERWGQKAD